MFVPLPVNQGFPITLREICADVSPIISSGSFKIVLFLCHRTLLNQLPQSQDESCRSMTTRRRIMYTHPIGWSRNIQMLFSELGERSFYWSIYKWGCSRSVTKCFNVGRITCYEKRWNTRGADKSLAKPGRKQVTFLTYYGTWRFITTFTRVHHLSLP